MPSVRIEDLKPGTLDASGNQIICIYAKKPPYYAVYSDPMRVAVHFDEDEKRESMQRKALACLYPLRGEVSGLVDGWRHEEVDEALRKMRRQRRSNHGTEDDRQPGVISRLWLSVKGSFTRADRARARRYDRRVADAMIVGLEGGIAAAVELLEDIRKDIIGERKAFAHTDYLVTAALTGVMLLVAIAIFSAPNLGMVRHPPKSWDIICTGAAAGVIGAFFSVATALRRRTVLIDLQKWDNRRDAILRIAVGTMGAGILLCLFLTGVVTITGFTAANLKPEPGNDPVLWAIVIGFIAGFSERAVPDLLAKASFNAADSDVATNQARAGAAKAAGAKMEAAAAASETSAVAAPSDALERESDAEIDACLCDAPAVAASDLTTDEELPITVGGVSTDMPAMGASSPTRDGVPSRKRGTRGSPIGADKSDVEMAEDGS
jgi:hypothetical protein